MTIITSLRKLAAVKVLVAIAACGVDGFEMPPSMASGTLDLGMLTGPSETAQSSVSKVPDLPVLETSVASVTRCFGKLVAMHIGMAERALRYGIVLKFSSRWMTTKARLLRVSGFEAKTRNRMVEVGLRPPFG
jgi:predicted small lipoprotein YifL